MFYYKLNSELMSAQLPSRKTMKNIKYQNQGFKNAESVLREC